MTWSAPQLRGAVSVVTGATRGEGFQTATLACRYGFVDVDGRTFEPFRMPDENRLSP